MRVSGKVFDTITRIKLHSMDFMIELVHVHVYLISGLSSFFLSCLLCAESSDAQISSL